MRPFLLLPLLLAGCAHKPPAELSSCTVIPNELVTMAICGQIIVAYQDITAPPDQGPPAFEGFNQGLVTGLTNKATNTPDVEKEDHPFAVNGAMVPGTFMTVKWDENDLHRQMSGYSAAIYGPSKMRLGACFGLADAGSEQPCLNALPYVMANGIKK